jgi:DNA-binding CsgD family transcriptional regulator
LRFGQRLAGRPPVNPLTPRQREVLGWLLKGDGERQIAHRLGISRHTANDHVKAIHRKLNASSRGELMAKFVRPTKD